MHCSIVFLFQPFFFHSFSLSAIFDAVHSLIIKRCSAYLLPISCYHRRLKLVKNMVKATYFYRILVCLTSLSVNTGLQQPRLTYLSDVARIRRFYVTLQFYHATLCLFAGQPVNVSTVASIRTKMPSNLCNLRDEKKKNHLYQHQHVSYKANFSAFIQPCHIHQLQKEFKDIFISIRSIDVSQNCSSILKVLKKKQSLS